MIKSSNAIRLVCIYLCLCGCNQIYIKERGFLQREVLYVPLNEDVSFVENTHFVDRDFHVYYSLNIQPLGCFGGIGGPVLSSTIQIGKLKNEYYAVYFNGFNLNEVGYSKLSNEKVLGLVNFPRYNLRFIMPGEHYNEVMYTYICRGGSVNRDTTDFFAADVLVSKFFENLR